MTDIMIDIETLSTATDALVLSVGVTEFKCEELEPLILQQKLVVPSLSEQILLGRHIDRETQKWWSKQPASAQEHWLAAGNLPIIPALIEIDMFFQEVGDDAKIWARGPHFDVAILQSLYEAKGRPAPWKLKFNLVRDVRTYLDGRTPQPYHDQEGTGRLPAHHPLADNRKQVIDLWQHGYRT